jgi:hypothetical protein
MTMKEVILFCVLLNQSLTVMGCHPPAPQEQRQLALQPATSNRQVNREWRAASYRGLRMGKSTRAEMLRVFGKPKTSEVFDEKESKSEVWYHYIGTWEFPGRLTIITEKRTGVISAIDLHPTALSREEVIKHFGNDYIVTRYDFDLCLGDEESAPLYESPNGSVIYIEYRERGIAVAVDEAGKVNEITYISEPIGAPSSKCKKSGT